MLLLLVGGAALRLLLGRLPAYRLRRFVTHVRTTFPLPSDGQRWGSSCSRWQGGGAAPSTCSTMSDQLHPAIDAEYALLASRCRMLRVAARLRAKALVDDAPARRAMADRCVRASMIHVVTRVASIEVSYHRVTPSPRVALLFCFAHWASASDRPSRTASQKRARASARPFPRSRVLFGAKRPSNPRSRLRCCQSHRQ